MGDPVISSVEHGRDDGLNGGGKEKGLTKRRESAVPPTLTLSQGGPSGFSDMMAAASGSVPMTASSHAFKTTAGKEAGGGESAPLIGGSLANRSRLTSNSEPAWAGAAAAAV